MAENQEAVRQHMLYYLDDRMRAAQAPYFTPMEVSSDTLTLLPSHQFNPLHANFFRGNKNIYLHFMSFLHVDITTGSALDGAVFDITQILAYLVHNMSRSQLYLGFGHFGWLPSFFSQ